MSLVPDWRWVIKRAWSVRVLAALAFIDFVAAVMLLFVDGAAAELIGDHFTAVVVALAAKSALSVFGIVLRVKVQKEAEGLVGVEA